MSEKETNVISLKDIWSVIKKNLIFTMIIIVVSTAIGTLYAFFVKKTTYSVSTTAVVKVGELQTGGTTNELNQFSFSVYLAPQCESVFKNKNNALRYKEKTGKSINVDVIKVTWQDQRFDLKITYSMQSREDVSQQLVNQLNDYIEFCIDYVDNDADSIWIMLKDRIILDKAMPEAVVSSSGKTSSIFTSFLMGLALAVVFLIIRFYIDDTITNKDTVEDIVGAPVLASISISANFNREGGQKNEN